MRLTAREAPRGAHSDWRETDRRRERGTDAASQGTQANVRLTAPGCTGSGLGFMRAGGSRAALESCGTRAGSLEVATVARGPVT
jgi:hypothetical protein